MLFRPLGNTGLRLSAIGLGGHWPTKDGRRYEDHFSNDDVPAAILANRTAVVDACLDVGINYIDITTAAEALAYGRALSGRRDQFIIGADDYQWSARNSACINIPALMANVERCLTRLRTDYLDIWRVTAEVHGRNTDAELEMVVETARRLRAAGKIRHLGLSSHHESWLRHAVTRSLELELVLAPCLPCTATCEAFFAATERRMGIIGIKPFAGGVMFASPACRPDEADKLAELSLRWILQHRPDVTCIAPGLSTVDQVQNAAAAAENIAITSDEMSFLRKAMADAIQALPLDYAWLANWASPSLAR